MSTIEFVIAVDYNDWLIPLGIASLPAFASILAAVLSARSAQASRAAEIDAARLRDLEERLAERKYDVYKPMIELLQTVMDSTKEKAKNPPNDFNEKVSAFATWISIFGSDEALRSFHNFMQGAYHSAPAHITLRLYADFVRAARRDMGYKNSDATHAELIGLRITDLYEKPEFRAAVELPFEELCDLHGWQIPWRI